MRLRSQPAVPSRTEGGREELLARLRTLSLEQLRAEKQERAAALGQLDRHTAQKLALRREMERVQERMTLKHKNTSRWVKHALKQHKSNAGLQQAIAEQLARGEELRRKQNDARPGAASDEEDREPRPEEPPSPTAVAGKAAGEPKMTPKMKRKRHEISI